jgi:glycosyltransferase involved in cell wall biosynthesis
VRVLLTAPPDTHSMYSELAAAPPRDVIFAWLPRGTGPVATGGRSGARRALELLGLPNFRVLPAVDGSVDLVHSTQHLLLTRQRWVVDIEHGQPFVGTRFSRLKNPVTRAVVLSVLRSPRCRAILPWTQTAAHAFTATYHPPPGVLQKIHVVHPAIRVPAAFAQVPPRPECRLLFVANRPDYNVLLKGGRELLAAFRCLREVVKHVSLTIVGPVPQWFRAACDATSGVVCTGPIPRTQLEQTYREAHIYVMPTSSDTFGMVFLEAMAHGLPVVALDRAYTREVIRHGETGLLVPIPESMYQWCRPDGTITMNSEPFIARIVRAEPDDQLVRSLGSALARLVEDEALRRRLGEAAREETTTGRFSIARRNAALHRVYSEAVDS